MEIIAKSALRIFTILIIFFILAILAFILIPSGLKFSHPHRPAEPKVNLAIIYNSQLQYFGKFGNYAQSENCFELLAWLPEGMTQYSYYCGQDMIPCTKCGGKCEPPVQSTVSERAFTIVAVGNIDNDPMCDVWTINDAKNLVNVVSDFSG